MKTKVKSIKDQVIDVICKSNNVEPKDLKCILDANMTLISNYYFYGFYIKSKQLRCFYWTDREEEIFADDILYFLSYKTFADYVNKRLHF